MKENTKKNNNIRTALLLTLILLLCLARIIFVFTVKKEGYHSDEPWSYGFANSLYYPYLYSDNADILLTNDNITNFNEWLPGSLFRDYLVVNAGEEFEFASVISNKSGDMSPPFFELILHAVCSFFPETFSWWYAFSINILTFILTGLVLFGIVRQVTGNNKIALFTTAFYGFSLGCVNTVIYLRMYALLTLFTLLTLYLFQKIFTAETGKSYLYILLGLTVVLGSYTHFYYLLFAFFFTAFYCLMMFCKKQFKKGLCLGLSMLAGVGVFLCIYPYAISMLLNGDSMYDGGITFPYAWLYRYVMNLLTTETLGIRWLVDKETFLFTGVGLFVLLMILAGMAFVFRKDAWFQKLCGRVGTGFKNLPGKIREKFRDLYETGNPLLLSAFLSVLISVAIVTKISYVEAMGQATDRYIFNLYPVLILTVFIFLYRILTKIRKYKRVLTGAVTLLAVGLLLRENAAVDSSVYLFNKGEDKTDLTEYCKDQDVIVVTNSPFRLEWYSVAVMDCHSVLFVAPKELEEAKESLAAVDGSKDYILIVEKADFISEDAVDPETGTVTHEVDDYSNWHNSQTESDFFKDLETAAPEFAQRVLQFTQGSFCGDLEVYRVR